MYDYNILTRKGMNKIKNSPLMDNFSMFEELLDPTLHKHLHSIGVDTYHLQRSQPIMKL